MHKRCMYETHTQCQFVKEFLNSRAHVQIYKDFESTQLIQPSFGLTVQTVDQFRNICGHLQYKSVQTGDQF